MKDHRIVRLLLFVMLAASASAQQSVETASVVSRTLQRTLTLPGEFRPFQEVNLYARVSAFVEKVMVDRGSLVEEGQLLAILAAPELAAQVAEADSKVQALEAQRAEAEARFISSQSTYERLKTAAATPGAVAANELILAEKSMEAAQAVVESLKESIRAAVESSRSLKDLQGYLEVKAPFSGVVTTRFVHPGALVGPASGTASTPMLRLEDDSRLRMVIAVPEADAGGIVKRAQVSFKVPAFPAETFSGTVARLAHSLDPHTRTMPVELDVPNPGLRLAPGMYAQTQWPVQNPRASILVPVTSIVTTNERQFVIRVNSGVAEWVTVTRGSTIDDLVEVLGALRAGDRVVRRGTDELREGTRVQVR